MYMVRFHSSSWALAGNYCLVLERLVTPYLILKWCRFEQTQKQNQVFTAVRCRIVSLRTQKQRGTQQCVLVCLWSALHGWQAKAVDMT